MRYIVVTGQERRMREVEAYLYEGQRQVSTELVQTPWGSYAVIVESPDANAQYVADRLGSGMFGARVFDTLDEAETYIVS